MQSNLMSDNFCGYNSESAPFFWTMQEGQYNNNFVIGEIGVMPAGGTAGSYQPTSLVDTDSFLQGRTTILSKCNPPIPSLDTVNRENFEQMTENSRQENLDSRMLLQQYTKEKRSQTALDSIDYNRFQPMLPANPQNLRNVIEDYAPQRGGTDTRNVIKSAWSNQNNSPNYSKDACTIYLDPSRDCGSFCEGINGYTQVARPYGKPPGQPDYPFNDTTSQQIFDTGAAPCGPTFFSGVEYDKGSCPIQTPQVLKNEWDSKFTGFIPMLPN